MQRLLISSKFLVPTLVIASIYVVFVTYIMNIRLVQATAFGSFSATYKVSLLFALLTGMWTAMSGAGLILLFATAILTGANLTLLVRQIKMLRGAQNLHFVVGGNTLLGVTAAGCTACGLPLLSILGLSGSIINLPFHGQELSYLAVILLSISFYLLLKSVFEKEYCVVPSKKNV